MPDARAIIAPMVVRVGLIQMVCSASPETNLRAAEERIREAAGRGARIICLPELFRSLYFCRSEDHSCFSLAEEIPGPTTAHFSALAGELEVVLIVPIFERRAPGLYHNSAAVFDADGSLLGIYRKMHIPDDPLYYEKFYFTPGDLGFCSWSTRHGRIGVLICWDQWFPEAARITAMSGAEILFYPTAIGWHPTEKESFGAGQQSSWQIIQRAHAIANGVFVAAVNRAGHEGPPEQGIEFWGSSFVCDASGNLIAQAASKGEQILLAECDLEAIDSARTHWPFLRDRRVDAYAAITQRFLL